MEHTTRELSKKLHDAGFRGEHTHDWVYDDAGKFMGNCVSRWRVVGVDMTSSFMTIRIPAYTFTELWRVLPFNVEEYGLMCWKTLQGTLALDYVSYDKACMNTNATHESPAEAVGLLLLWLIEQGLFATGGE